uniref:CSON000518 protein n=1 Tax=Culicoides sonorensis TaxID=179676 RepID=A0A336MSB4_CULSO
MPWLEEIPYIKTCFCCLPQRPGNILIGVTGVFVYLGLFIIYLLNFINNEVFQFENVKHWAVIYYGIETILMTWLLYSVFKKQKILLSLYLWIQLGTYMAAFTLVFYFFYTEPRFALSVLIYSIFSMYLWLCHTSYYQELTGSYVMHMAPSVCKA